MTIPKKIKLVKPGIILLGFITLVTQIILLREFLTFFNGNELVIGIILANWMLLTGLGAYLGRFLGQKENRKRWILTILNTLAFLPIITVLALHWVWYATFQPGIMVGIAHVFFYSLFILAPFCIISGIMFTLCAKEESIRIAKNRIGDVYAWESLGSLLGGAILNFILIWIFTTFQSLFVIMLFVAVGVIFLGFRAKDYIISIITFMVAAVFIFMFALHDFDYKVRELAFPNQNIIYANDSPFGIFVVTQQKDQVNYYENNILMATSGDIISREESVHFAMVQHKQPQDVLVLSGLIEGIIKELQKYDIKLVDYVDVNPEIIKLAKQSLNDVEKKRVRLIEKDPVRFLRENNKKYDVVLINLPKPSTIQLNRYYTQDFFHLLKQNLNTDAVISLSVSSSGNYMSDEARKFLSILYKTISTEFNNILILPVSDDFLIASDHTLSYNITQRIDSLEISTEYVNSNYFDRELLAFRGKQINEQIDLSVSLNKNLSPVFYQSQIELWMSQFNIKYWIPAVIILIFSGFFFFKADIIYKGVFAAGFAGTTIEIILILVFQVVFGYVYAVVGIFVMLFMGGLALGAYYVPKFFDQDNNIRLFKKLQFSIAVFAFVLPLIFLVFKSLQMPDIILFIVFILLISVISVLAGGIFSVASRILNNTYENIASKTYGLDLLGAATGALLFTIYLIPLLGFGWSVAVIGLFNLVIALSAAK